MDHISSSSSPIEIFFFPFVGGGHQIPMIDIARIFASHGANSTIITTPKHSLSFLNSIRRDQSSGRPISIHTLELPENVDIADTDMSAPGSTDTSMLQEPLVKLLIDRKPDCIVHDVFHRWSGEAIDGTGISRITFNGNGCFARCVQENIGRFKPHENEKVESDYEPFIVPGIPDRIELTRSQLPSFARHNNGGSHRKIHKPDNKNVKVIINSFHELEPAYVDYLQTELGNKVWLVGPVSLYNRNVEDKAERGQKTSVNEQIILNWLDGKKSGSVLYLNFGSVARMAPQQLPEIAAGLEASGHQFIWVVGKFLDSSGSEECVEQWLPDGLEHRIQASGKGLIIKGWAPQLLILEHKAIGGFVSHCGWNSTLEGVSFGLPMITWPLGAEQFTNEKLITDVLKIGVKVGSLEWQSWNTQKKAIVGREKVEMAIRKVMDFGDEEGEEMRKRARVLGLKAKKAVEEGGSSFVDVDNLIQELKSRRRN
ncbi:abscisate beta-glucosyltransferase-like [Euphorbia lathyris]|uniref:abscisate beta-glucosyltransferase-like n=1 Tax=Euphorbia lathyris TaxID=212925 RepID=UPI00331332A4